MSQASTEPRTSSRSTLARVRRAARWVVALGFVHLALTGDLIGQPEGGPDGEAPATEPPVTALRPIRNVVEKAEDIASIEDPVALRAAGEHWLAKGNKVLARACFEAAVEREEINHYADYVGTVFAEAVVLEHLGDFEASRAKWHQGIHEDVLTAYGFITRSSVDPQRAALLAEARAQIDDVVARVKAGEEPHWYTTKKGESRTIKAITSAEALAAFDAGERLIYVYIDELDLTGRTFTKRVGCKRCIVGKLKAYGSTFEEQLDFHGVVLGEAHIGKFWEGEVNRSAFIEGATLNRLQLPDSVFLGGLNLDSVKVTGRVLNLPLTTIEGDLDLRHAAVQGALEMRYASVSGKVIMRGAELSDVGYFGHANMGGLDLSRLMVQRNPLFFDSARFTGPVDIERCELNKGATFENALFEQSFAMRQCKLDGRLNLSRTRVLGDWIMSDVEATDLVALGIEVLGESGINDCVFGGNVQFALDGLTRREHLTDPAPLHKQYKVYQGDVDAEEDLTSRSQYGVTHVDDLTAVLHGRVSFANSIFEKFVSFEGVRFGALGGAPSSFYNAQFYGEAHFERTEYFGEADFRTITGVEVSFNDAVFHDTWMMDDANVGRLSVSGSDLLDGATLSFYGAQFERVNLVYQQLVNKDGEHNLFFEQCMNADLDNEAFLDDPRLEGAYWDSQAERAVTDPDEVARRARSLCADHAIGEFVLLMDSFDQRSMKQENDWAYWHMRHYKNLHEVDNADSFVGKAGGWLQWLVFEKGFGWGVRLGNLFGTGLAIILFCMLAIRLFCANTRIEWDNEVRAIREMSLFAQFVISLHAFMGQERDWDVKTSNPMWKIIFTAEMVIGIVVTTFFVGAYTAMVLR